MMKNVFWKALLGLALGLSACTSMVDPDSFVLECKDAKPSYFCGEGHFCGEGTCIRENNKHCGRRNNACGEGAVCRRGQCFCETTGNICTQSCCASGCIDTQSSETNCGSCGHRCPVGQVCVDGQCSCTSPEKKCGDACVNTQSSVQHCGDCGQACPASNASLHIHQSRCEQGLCKLDCELGFADKDGDLSNGCEANLNQRCGNGSLEEGEACDGRDFGTKSCASLDPTKAYGILQCSPDCLSIDSSACASKCTPGCTGNVFTSCLGEKQELTYCENYTPVCDEKKGCICEDGQRCYKELNFEGITLKNVFFFCEGGDFLQDSCRDPKPFCSPANGCVESPDSCTNGQHSCDGKYWRICVNRWWEIKKTCEKNEKCDPDKGCIPKP